jgi:flavin reductase (DIM6/NTAB) family NADH-FMN oxidoreductase RutF
LGCFATGVAVATTLDKGGRKSGMTINSFNSVSLDPPLVLWSIDRASNNFETFLEADHFAVHVLKMDQQSICERFAARGIDKFEGLDCTEGVACTPILPNYSAVFECGIEHRYDGGDHVILVGRVLKFEDRKTDPLIFYRGRYLE